MSNIEKIRQEIERLKKEQLTRNSIGVITGSAFFVKADELLAFIDSLPEEKPSEDLEVAADEFANQDCVTFISRKKGFIAGAKWQKEQLK